MSNTFFIKNDGSLWGCGLNELGQLGDGTTTDRHDPVPLSISNVVYISGRFHTLFTASDGSVYGCGSNLNGELGQGSISESMLSPVLIPISNVKKSVAGPESSMFLTNDGKIYLCGNSKIQGNGDAGDVLTPTFRDFGKKAIDIAGGGIHFLIAFEDGTAKACGGNNTAGQFGTGSTANNYLFNDCLIDNVEKVFAMLLSSVFVKKNKSVWGCGSNATGELGTGDTTSPILTPLEVLQPWLNI